MSRVFKLTVIMAPAVVPSQEDIVIGGAKKEEQPQGAVGTKTFVKDYEPLAAAGQELKGKLVMITTRETPKQARRLFGP